MVKIQIVLQGLHSDIHICWKEKSGFCIIEALRCSTTHKIITDPESNRFLHCFNMMLCKGLAPHATIQTEEITILFSSETEALRLWLHVQIQKCMTIIQEGNLTSKEILFRLFLLRNF